MNKNNINQNTSQRKKIYLTTPIYYPNDKPHLGHAYTSVLTDFLSRFYKLHNYDVLFSTGLDEHGQKIEKTAKQKGVTPQQHVDNMVPAFTELLRLYNINYDKFIRTTSSAHKQSAKYLWKKLKDNDYIYLNKYSGWYDVSDEAFVKSDEIKDVNPCKTKAITHAGKQVIWVEEECYYFRLSAFKEKLVAFYTKHPKAIYPKSRYNEIMGFLKQDLHDIAVSRTTIDWGIEVPTKDIDTLEYQGSLRGVINNILNIFKSFFDRSPRHVMYVWIDALTNYLTALGFPNADMEAEVLPYWENSIQVLGKDIVRFHAVYWPAFLMGIDLHPPKQLLVHGWWLADNAKMSKSFGNVIEPIALAQEYGVDEIRWFFLREMNIGDDAQFTQIQLHSRLNELANLIGNLLQRVLALLHKNYDSKVIEQTDVFEIDSFFKTLNEAVQTYKVENYAEAIVELARKANQYIDQNKPWENGPAAHTVLSNCVLILKAIGTALLPIMPIKANKLLRALGVSDESNENEIGNTFISQKIQSFSENHKVGMVDEILFKRY